LTWLVISLWYRSFMTLRELPEVQSLSLLEKLELVDELWKSVSIDVDSMELAREEKEALDTRWARFLQSPSSALTVDQFKAELNALRA